MCAKKINKFLIIATFCLINVVLCEEVVRSDGNILGTVLKYYSK